MNKGYEAERSADNKSVNGADPSAYTMGDLVAAVDRLQAEANYILAICEDLPPDAFERVCNNRYGKKGADDITGLMANFISFEPVKSPDNDA